MKVYILQYDDNFGDVHKIEGVFATFERALEEKDKLIEFMGIHNLGGIYGIKAWPVQE